MAHGLRANCSRASFPDRSGPEWTLGIDSGQRRPLSRTPPMADLARGFETVLMTAAKFDGGVGAGAHRRYSEKRTLLFRFVQVSSSGFGDATRRR